MVERMLFYNWICTTGPSEVLLRTLYNRMPHDYRTGPDLIIPPRCLSHSRMNECLVPSNVTQGRDFTSISENVVLQHVVYSTSHGLSGLTGSQ